MYKILIQFFTLTLNLHLLITIKLILHSKIKLIRLIIIFQKSILKINIFNLNMRIKININNWNSESKILQKKRTSIIKNSIRIIDKQRLLGNMLCHIDITILVGRHKFKLNLAYFFRFPKDSQIESGFYQISQTK